MEKDITNWQNLWKEEKSTPLDVSKLIIHLNKIEKKGKLERIILLVAVPVTIIVLALLLPILSNIYYLITIVIVSFGMMMILIQSYKSKYRLISNDAELNNHKYIKNLIHKLKQRMLTTSRYMWFYTFLLVLGINIGYIDVLQKFYVSITVRIFIHIIFTVLMICVMYYSIENRKKENNKRILPLIDFLENLN
ncbi:hypothetical protein [Patiriisocius marinus]|uniref:Uncharacterized protein n=1 Tax=Patiriisocius marinus TaxID=1397112 RepID=A0A5J4INN2_9FLAO|nr:hypothetical protein [Patiriisocius marinus]GER59125.1 hypothetical protein ULMA_12330 [Patiriisocius marinus]